MNVLNILKSFGISTEEWGKGSAKTVKHLQTEVDEAETELVPEGEKLVRLTKVLNIIVFCEVDGKTFKLNEDRQVFTDGRVRRRNNTCSVAEKLKAGEEPSLESVNRAISEELGVNQTLRVQFGETKTKEQESPSYPGLTARYTLYGVTVDLHPDDYEPEGYVEKQDDKSTFFVWKEVK